MSPSDDHVERLVADLTEQRIDRRQFFKRAAGLGLSLPAATAILAACGGEEEQGGGGETAAATGGTLRLHLDEDIENLDPAIQPGHADTNVATNIFEQLVAYKPGSFETANTLAESWEGSTDGLRWQFKLKEGIPFHKDFGELTAEDVKYSFERIAGLTKPKLESPYAGDWATLDHVQVDGKYEGVVVLKEPFAPLMTTTVPVQSGSIVSKKAVEEMGAKKFATNPVGTGPYEFVSWSPTQKVVLKKFGEYGRANSDYAQPAPWDEIDFVVIGEDNPTTIALESGQLDFAVLPTDAVERFQGNDQFAVEKRTSLNYNWIGMNVTHPVLQDKNVRLAIRYGVDVPSMIEAAFNGLYTQATAEIAPGMPVGYWEEGPKYERDVEKAKQYVEQANAVGQELVFSVSNAEPGADKIAEIAQQNLQEIGLKIKVEVQESAQFDQATKAANEKKQLFYTGFTTNPDPSWVTVWFTCEQVSVWNYMSWCNEEYSSLDKEGARTVDEAQRQDIYVRMQQAMDEDVPAVWVAWPTLYFAAKAGITPSIRPDGTVYYGFAFRPAA
jgi:peptide/nickel transport system substrate-binding protein